MISTSSGLHVPASFAVRSGCVTVQIKGMWAEVACATSRVAHGNLPRVILHALHPPPTPHPNTTSQLDEDKHGDPGSDMLKIARP